MGDVGRLLADDVENPATRPIETHVGGVVADIEDRLANQRFHIDPRSGRHFAGDDHYTGLDQRFAGHSPARVRVQNCIEYRVRYLVSDLIRVTLGHRLRRETKILAHDVIPSGT
jgi:hypothetical protein